MKSALKKIIINILHLLVRKKKFCFKNKTVRSCFYHGKEKKLHKTLKSKGIEREDHTNDEITFENSINTKVTRPQLSKR